MIAGRVGVGLAWVQRELGRGAEPGEAECHRAGERSERGEEVWEFVGRREERRREVERDEDGRAAIEAFLRWSLVSCAQKGPRCV